MKKLLCMIILTLFTNNIIQTMDMEIDQGNGGQQSSAFLNFPVFIFGYIATYLSWHDISRTCQACTHLDATFNDPIRPITLNYAQKREPRKCSKFFNPIFEQLQALHKKPKFDLNPITLLLSKNKLSEAPARRAFGTFLKKLHEHGMSKHIQMIDMSCNNLTLPLHPAIATFPLLRKIAFFANNPKAITAFPQCFPALQRLGISVYNNNTNALDLDKWPQLRKLDLDINSIFENLALLQELPTLTQLRSLFMHGAENDIIYFLPIYMAIQIAPRTHLTAENMEHICQIPSLENLALRTFDIDINGEELAAHFAAMRQLRKLYLRDVNILCQQNIQDYSKIQFNEETHRYVSTDPTTPIINPEDNLETICQTLSHSNNLEVFDVSHNRLRSLAPSITCLTQLKKLDLFANRLEELPDQLNHLTNLEELNVSTFPESLTDTPDLKFNPDILANIPKLQKLYVLATRPRTNNLPLLHKLIHLRNQFSEDPDELASIRRHLNHLKPQDNISPFTQQGINFVEKTLALLNPSVTRSQLEMAQIIIEEILRRGVHPLQELEIILEIAHRAHNQPRPESENPRPKKRQRSE